MICGDCARAADLAADRDAGRVPKLSAADRRRVVVGHVRCQGRPATQCTCQHATNRKVIASV